MEEVCYRDDLHVKMSRRGSRSYTLILGEVAYEENLFLSEKFNRESAKSKEEKAAQQKHPENMPISINLIPVLLEV